MRKLLFILSAVVLSFSAVRGQEVLVPLQVNDVQAQYNRMAARFSLTVLDTIALPSSGLYDDFSYDSHIPDTNLWDLSLNPGVYVNRGWATAPVNIGVCTFDGLDVTGFPYNPLAQTTASELADVLTSRHLDLSGYDVSDSVYLSFWWEAQGKGYAPNPLDSIQLQVNIPAWNTSGEVWKTIWFQEGYNPSGTDTTFHLAMIKLDTSIYFVDGFRFRFRNYASTCGSNDHWHIDELRLKSNRSFSDTVIQDVNFVYGMPTLLKDFSAVPGTHYNASLMNNTAAIYIRNNDSIDRNVTYSFEVFQPGNPTAVYTYNGGADGQLEPFEDFGYSNYAPHANPVYSFAYPSLPTDTGYFLVNHMLKKGTAVNSPVDTVQYKQRFYNYYSYDDGSAEVGYGLYGANSLLAYRFDMPVGVTDTLKAVQMHFLPVLDIDNLQYRQFKLTVWNHNSATNGPGNVIYQQAGYSPYYAPDVPNRFAFYTIDSGTVVLNGTFYVGWQQLAADRLYIGFDYSNDQKDKIYYNTSGVWYTSIYSGSVMMRPVFSSLYDASSVSEIEAERNWTAYPVPANDQLTLKGLDHNIAYQVHLYNLAGQNVMQSYLSPGENTLGISDLEPGMYLLQLSDEHGSYQGTQKIIVE